MTRKRTLKVDTYDVVPDRGSEWMTYRFVQNPDHHRYGLMGCRSGGKLKGALVYKLRQERGLPALFVADIVATGLPARRTLWAAAVQHAAWLNCALVAALGPTGAQGPAEHTLPFVPRVVRPAPVIISKEGNGPALLADDTSWAFAVASSDNI